LFSGAFVIYGFGAHMALMIAGIAGVAAGRLLWGRPLGPRVGRHIFTGGGDNSSANGSSESRAVSPTIAEAVRRVVEWLRCSLVSLKCIPSICIVRGNIVRS